MLNRYLLSRDNIKVLVAADDPYEARLMTQKSANFGRASRAWMSPVVKVEVVEVLTSDLEPAVIDVEVGS